MSLDALTAWMREALPARTTLVAGPKREAGGGEKPAEELIPELPRELVRHLVRDMLALPDPSDRLLVYVSKSVRAVVAAEWLKAKGDVGAATLSVSQKEKELRLFLGPLWKLPSAMEGPEAFDAFWDLEAEWLRAANAGFPEKMDERLRDFGISDPSPYRRTFLVSSGFEGWTTFEAHPRRDKGIWTSPGTRRAEWKSGVSSPTEPLVRAPGPSVGIVVRVPGTGTRPTRLQLRPGDRGATFGRPPPAGSPPWHDERPARADDLIDPRIPRVAIYLGPVHVIEIGQYWDPYIPWRRLAKGLAPPEGPSDTVAYGIPIEGTLEAARRGPPGEPLQRWGETSPATSYLVRSARNALVAIGIASIRGPPFSPGDDSRVANARRLHAEFTARAPWTYDPMVDVRGPWAYNPTGVASRSEDAGTLLIPLPLFLSASSEMSTGRLDAWYVIIAALPVEPGWQSDSSAWRVFVQEPSVDIEIWHYPRGYAGKLAPRDVVFLPNDPRPADVYDVSSMHYDDLKVAGLVFQSSFQ